VIVSFLCNFLSVTYTPPSWERNNAFTQDLSNAQVKIKQYFGSSRRVAGAKAPRSYSHTFQEMCGTFEAFEVRPQLSHLLFKNVLVLKRISALVVQKVEFEKSTLLSTIKGQLDIGKSNEHMFKIGNN
jgi:hypothetical protein